MFYIGHKMSHSRWVWCHSKVGVITWSLLTISDAPHILECISRQKEVKNTPHGAYSWWGLFEGKLPGCTQTKWWHKMVSEKKMVSESERKWKWSRSVVSVSVTPWTAAHQAPLSVGFFRQEYWSGLLFSSPGDLPDPGIKPRSPVLQADAGRHFNLWVTREAQNG